MKKELFKQKVNITDLSDMSFSDEVLKIGGFTFTSHHTQDCCEHVSADFSVFSHVIDNIKSLNDVVEIRIVAEKGMGFTIFFSNSQDSKIGVLVPCHNNQDGYYSDELDLVIKQGGVVTYVDLQVYQCVKDTYR